MLKFLHIYILRSNEATLFIDLNLCIISHAQPVAYKVQKVKFPGKYTINVVLSV